MKAFLATLLVLAVTVLLAACDDGDGSPSGGARPPATLDPAPTPTRSAPTATPTPSPEDMADEALALLENGDYSDAAHARALPLLEEAAEGGNAWAQERVGRMYQEGRRSRKCQSPDEPGASILRRRRRCPG